MVAKGVNVRFLGALYLNLKTLNADPEVLDAILHEVGSFSFHLSYILQDGCKDV